MIKSVLPLSVLLVGHCASAQTPFFRLYYDQDTLGWGSNLVIEAANADIVQVSWQFEYGTDSTYLLFQRFSADGDLLVSTRTLPQPGAVLHVTCGAELPGGDFLLFGMDQQQHAIAVRLDAMGDLVSVRRRNGDPGRYEAVIWENDTTLLALGIDAIADGGQLLMSRFDPAGNHLGSQGVRIDGHGATAIAATPSTSGGLLICATGYDTIPGGWSTQARTCLLKLDSAGGVEWAKRYILSGKLISPAGMAELSDGTILIGGAVSWFPDPTSHLLFMHTAADGDTLWQRELNLDLAPDTVLYPRAFVAASDTSFLFTGWMGNYRGFALRVDDQGLIGSAARITASLTLDRSILTSAGDLVIPASDLPTGNFAGGVGLGLWRTSDPFALVCTEPLDINATDFDVAIGQGFTEQAITMNFDDITAQCTQMPAVMIAYDPCVPDAIETTGPKSTTAFEVWPVPATQHVTVAAPRAGRIIVIDATGRPVFTGSLPANGSTVIDIRGLSDGPYHLLLQDDSGVTARKLIKQ